LTAAAIRRKQEPGEIMADPASKADDTGSDVDRALARLGAAIKGGRGNKKIRRRRKHFDWRLSPKRTRHPRRSG